MADSANQPLSPQAIQLVQRLIRAVVGSDQPAPPQVIQAAEPVMINTVLVGNSAPRRFQFTIDPKTPLKDLLPVPPNSKDSAPPVIVKDLTQVQEVQFQMPLAKLPTEEAQKQTAHTMAKINHLNDKKTDGFLEALRRERLDLTGMPLAMGDTCRTKGERSKQLAVEVAMVRGAFRPQINQQFQAFGQINTIISAPQSINLQPTQGVAGSTSASPAPTPQPVQTPVPGSPAPPPPAGTPTPSAPAQAPQPTPAPAAGGPVPPASPSGPAPPATALQPPPVFVDNDSAAPAFFPVMSFGQPVAAEKFWEQYQTDCVNADKNLSRIDRCHQELVTLTRIAALMQVLAPESPGIRLGLVKYLAGISHAEATRALAKVAIFSAEDVIRQRALDALKVRRERDYTDILLAGLRYPWPDVARRAADALVKLERTDLVPQLVDLLDEPDPRAPVVREENHKPRQEVRELVRVNHHRNCLLCHAPANTGTVASDTLTAAVPVPSDPLPSPSQGYQNSLPDILVRIDVTYLRQDFSMFQAVADANPWPEMQRFDFLVRTRALTDKEADSFRENLIPKEPGVLSPYHRAALTALRELTGRDTAPNSEAWRQLLKLPAKAPVAAASLRTASAR